jgi:hypothetical protein
MKRFVIETSDREFILALRKFNSDDITVEEPLQKAFGPIEIAICIHATSKLIDSITRLLEVILSHSSRKPNKTKTTAYAKKSEKEIRKLMDPLKDVIEIEYADEDEE